MVPLYAIALLLGTMVFALVWAVFCEAAWIVPTAGFIGAIVAAGIVVAIEKLTPRFTFSGAFNEVVWREAERLRPWMAQEGWTQSDHPLAWSRDVVTQSREGEPVHFIFLHGNGASASSFADYCNAARLRGWRCSMLEYPGYDGPGQTTSLETVRASVRDQIRALRRPGERVILAGFSVGGALAWDMVDEVQPDALLLLNTFSAVRDIKPPWTSLVPPDYLDWNIDAHTGWRGRRVAIVATRDDELFDARHVDRIREWAERQGHAVTVEWLEDGGHSGGPVLHRGQWERVLDTLV